MEDTIEALGKPLTSRMIGAIAKPAAAVARWRHGPMVIDLPPSNAIRLAVSLIDARNARTRDLGALATGRHGDSVSLFAPQESLSLDVRGEADVVQLLTDGDILQATLDKSFACPPVLNLHDDAVRRMIMRLFVRAARGDPDDRLMEEENLQWLIVRLAQHAKDWHHDQEMPSMLFRGGLAPAAFRRLEEMIENAVNEAGSLTLDQMAHSTGLSITHFVRAFRRHTGHTPHKYIVRRRLDRAVALLRLRAISVADVAGRVGFSTPAHFVATFRTVIGVPPGTLRDALGN